MNTYVSLPRSRRRSPGDLASRAMLPGDETIPPADTVVVRPDRA